MALANQIGLSSKVVSERHFYASREKLTAGEAAKSLGKMLDAKVSAKEIVEAFKLLNGLEPEWHHSGFYKGLHGSTMGRTYFFTENQVENLAYNWFEVSKLKDQKEAEIQKQKENIITGFYYTWKCDYSGRYGKKVNYKVLHAYEGSELNQPRNFTACTPGELLSVKLKEGKIYRGWDEPLPSEFDSISKIKYNKIIRAKV